MGGGIDVKFRTFDGRERVTKIEEVRTREEFCSFGDSEIIECPLLTKRLPSRKSRDSSKLQHLHKANLILLAKYTNTWPCPVSLRVITHRPVAFCSWPTEPTLTKHSCNIIGRWRCTPANAQAMKFTNYLYLHKEQLLEAC